MDSMIQNWLSAACHEGQEWLSAYLKKHPDATAADVWSAIPHSEWVLWAAVRSPGLCCVELVPRTCAVAAAFARAALPKVRDQDRAICVCAIKLAETVARGERIDRDVATAARAAVVMATLSASVEGFSTAAVATAMVRNTARAAEFSVVRSSESASQALQLTHHAALRISVHTEVGATAMTFVPPTADEVRALLGPAEDWLGPVAHVTDDAIRAAILQLVELHVAVDRRSLASNLLFAIPGAFVPPTAGETAADMKANQAWVARFGTVRVEPLVEAMVTEGALGFFDQWLARPGWDGMVPA